MNHLARLKFLKLNNLVSNINFVYISFNNSGHSVINCVISQILNINLCFFREV